MATQATAVYLSVKTTVLCLALVFFVCTVVYSQSVRLNGRLNYSVDSLDDTRNAMLSYSSGSSKSGGPSNNFLRTVYEIERSVYDAQAIRSYYRQSPARLRKIEGIIKLAAKQGSSHFIRQSLGHALYTANEIEKRKLHMHSLVRRKKRCSLCAGAMKEFMKKIEKAIGKTNFVKFIGNKNMAKATLMFAIDDTGSMSGEIQAAKDIAEYIVKYPRPNLQVDYILSPFNDPEKGRAIKKEHGKGTEFVNEIKALWAHGGGDCPEMAFKGMIKALDESPENDSPLYVFTDAPPKDATPDNIDDVEVRAKAQGINVYFFATIGCGDPASLKPFEKLARETCGQIFELPKDSSDIAKMKSVAKNLLGGATCSGGIGGFFPGKKKRSATYSNYKLLVDDTMARIIVSVSSEKSGANIDLKDPRSVPVTSGKTVVSKVTIFQVHRPRPGMWKLVVPPGAGKHTYMFKGSSQTNLDFDFIFVIPRHQGSPIPISHPLTGTLTHVILIVREANKVQTSSLSLEILGEVGKALKTATVRPVGTGGAHFSASFITPSVPFKLQLKGKTKKNYDFERNSQSTVIPSHVVVRVLYARNEFTVPKSSYEYVMFFVYNTGATEVFDYKVKNTSKLKAQIYSRSSAVVFQNRLAFFAVRFTATPSAVPGAADNVLVTVTGRTTKVSDSHLVSLMVA